jgi:predicted transport protein
LDDVLSRTSDRSRSIVEGLFDRLDRFGRRRNDRIRKRVGRYWVAFRSDAQGRVFAELRPHRGRVEVFILPPPRALSDPGGHARRAPASQGWGWFRTRFEIASTRHLAEAYDLVRQSYEDGRSRRSRAARRARAQRV